LALDHLELAVCDRGDAHALRSGSRVALVPLKRGKTTTQEGKGGREKAGSCTRLKTLMMLWGLWLL
jgi:hypothetical protein